MTNTTHPDKAEEPIREEPMLRVCSSCGKEYAGPYKTCDLCREAESIQQYFKPVGGTGKRG